MSNSGLEKNGLYNSGTHLLQYDAFVVTAFAFIIVWAFFYDANFSVKIVQHLNQFVGNYFL